MRSLLRRFLYRVIRYLMAFYNDYRYKEFREKYSIADSFIFNGSNIDFYGNGNIECGEHSYIGNYSTIQSGDGQLVKVGINTSISHNVRIYTNSAKANQNMEAKKTAAHIRTSGNVIIGNNVWIGANVFVNDGIEIGDNCVIGANAVVTRSLPSHSICVGVPAKVVKFKSYLDADECAKLANDFADVLSPTMIKKYAIA